MTSLKDKILTALLGEAHDQVDKIALTPKAYKQRIRELGDGLKSSMADRDAASGRVTLLEGQLLEKQATIVDLQGGIDTIIGDGIPENDGSADDLALQMGDVEEQIAKINGQIADAKAERDALIKVIDLAQAEYRQRVDGLQAMTLKAAAAKRTDNIAGTIEDLQDLTDVDGIDSITRKIDEESATAAARFQRVSEGLEGRSAAEQDVKLIKARQMVAKRRAQLAGAVKNAAATVVTPQA